MVGNVPRNFLVRVVGPALSGFGVTGAVADPVVEIYNGTTLMGRNDDWGGTSAMTALFALAGAFPIPVASVRDSALVISLPAGVYNARATGLGGTTGLALLELYELP